MLGYHKFCTRWIPEMLMGVHKTQRMASALTSLERYHRDGDEFLNYSMWVTGDETWVSFMDVKTKEQSKQWMHTHSPNKPRKFKQTLSSKKLMATVFWGRKGVLMVEFMQHETTLTSEVYCKKRKKLGRIIQNKGRGMLISMTMRIHIQLLALKHCWRISTGSCLTTRLTALISLQATTTC
jgi:hypothetical protein